MGEIKATEMKLEDGHLVILVDPNKNGKPVLKVILDIAEVPSEIAELFKKK